MPKLAINGGQPVRKKLFPAYKVIGDEEKKAVIKTLDSGILSKYLGCWHKDFYGGPEIRFLEKEWAKYFKVKHAIAVNSCTSGLIAAVGAAGISPGDEVIVSPYSMVISATAPLWYGGIPVFADIEEEYFCLEPRSVEKKITKKTKAIIVVDIFGQPYNADAINAIAKKHNLAIIEDCAQAPGVKYKGKYAGTIGDIGIYSLNYHKHIHAGEGGIIVTNSDDLADRARLISNHAEAVVEEKGVKNLVNMVGQNFRLTELQAAIAREQLKKLERLIKERVANCEYLNKKISEISGIRASKIREGAEHAYYLQPFLFDEKIVGLSRNKFINAVAAELPVAELRESEGKRIECGYVKPIYLMPIFQKRIAFGKNGYPFNLSNSLNYNKGICPVAERMYEKELFHHDYMRPPATKDDLDDVTRAFEKVYEYRNELK